MNEKSITEIACELHEPEARIRYLIGKHNIVPSRIVGNCRVYDVLSQGMIKEALFNMRIQKG